MARVRHLSTRCRFLFSVLALTTSACQTIEDSSVVNTWRPAQFARPDGGQSGARAKTGTPLLADRPASDPTFLEGTGRFVGAPSPATQAAATDAGGEGVTLNLVNVPAPQAAKTVLGDILGVKYTVDPTVEGKITIQTPSPVTKVAAVDLFQSALRSNGAAIVNSNGTYKIVPADQAPVGAIIATGSAPEPGGKLGSGLQVVQLKYVAASEMRRILEPMAPRGAIVRADDARHTLTLSGNGQDVAGMMEAISIFDVDVMRGMSFALVPVRISDPAAIADELKTVFSSEREGPMADMVQFLPNKRLGAILVISPQRGYLERAADWVHRLDAQAAGSEKQFLHLLGAEPARPDLVDVLQSMFSGDSNGARGGGPRNVAPQYREANVQSGGQRAIVAVVEHVRRRRRDDWKRGPRDGRAERLRPLAIWSAAKRREQQPRRRRGRPGGPGRGDGGAAHQGGRRRLQERGSHRIVASGLSTHHAGDRNARRDAEPGAAGSDHRRGDAQRRAQVRRALASELDGQGRGPYFHRCRIGLDRLGLSRLLLCLDRGQYRGDAETP